MINILSGTAQNLIKKKTNVAQEQGSKNDLDYLDFMDEDEINEILVTHMPIVKLAPGEYMFGTKRVKIQVKANGILINVGGGFATLSEYIKQNAPFECIKIAMVMKEK